jgi:hypothetical protein
MRWCAIKEKAGFVSLNPLVQLPIRIKSLPVPVRVQNTGKNTTQIITQWEHKRKLYL